MATGKAALPRTAAVVRIEVFDSIQSSFRSSNQTRVRVEAIVFASARSFTRNGLASCRASGNSEMPRLANGPVRPVQRMVQRRTPGTRKRIRNTGPRDTSHGRSVFSVGINRRVLRPEPVRESGEPASTTGRAFSPHPFASPAIPDASLPSGQQKAKLQPASSAATRPRSGPCRS